MFILKTVGFNITFCVDCFKFHFDNILIEVERFVIVNRY